MHAFVAAVLLRLAWLDPFVPDAQSQPQHRELTQSCGCSTGEGTSVVGANRFRQSELAKGGFEYRPGVLAVGSLYGTTTQQVSTVGIRNRERIAARAILGKKPSFEIRAPNLIRSFGMFQRFRVGRRPFSPPAWMRQPLAP
jgi:hypothetical protein